MKSRQDIAQITDFLYVNRDFFSAPFLSSSFQLWAKENKDAIEALSNDMIDSLDKDPRIRLADLI